MDDWTFIPVCDSITLDCTHTNKIYCMHAHGRPQGGARGGTCPPLEIQKYGGPPKDNLTRNFF